MLLFLNCVNLLSFILAWRALFFPLSIFPYKMTKFILTKLNHVEFQEQNVRAKETQFPNRGKIERNQLLSVTHTNMFQSGYHASNQQIATVVESNILKDVWMIFAVKLSGVNKQLVQSSNELNIQPQIVYNCEFSFEWCVLYAL